MTKNRLEAFSDGVIAIIITVMVLELKVPDHFSFSALQGQWPEFASYVVSYTMLGIYWNNHHHLFHSVDHISGSVMWANLHLLFWLSLLPFTTEWISKANFIGAPVALFGIVLLLSGVAYSILTKALVKANGPDSAVAKGLGDDFKGKISVVIYAIAIPFFAYAPYFTCACYVAVGLIWFVPDRRFAHHPVEENPD